MANTIKIGSNDIDDIKIGSSSVTTVYVGTNLVWSGGTTPTAQTPCFAVTDNISQYFYTEFEDVYETSSGDWYKLNNLDQYEEYGLYGTSRNITTYNGKLTLDSGYEYQYSGSAWNNVGAISGSSRVPVGYTEVEYIENTDQAYIDIGFKPNQDTRIITEMQTVTSVLYGRFVGAGGYNALNGMQFDYETMSTGTLNISWGTINGWTSYNYNGDYNKHKYDWNKNTFTIDDGVFTASTTYGSFQCTENLGIFCNIYNGSGENWLKGRMYSFKLYDDGTLIRDLVPCTRDSDGLAGAYDIVNDVFYYSPNSSTFSAGSATTHVVYPMYYEEKSAPPNYLSFSSMTEAEEYECPWVGMIVTINGDKYVFSGDSQSGYEWVYKPSRLPNGYTEVEYVENINYSYIDTGFKPNQDTRVVLNMQMVTSTSYPRLCGASAWNATDGIAMAYQQDGGRYCLHMGWFGSTSWSYYTSYTQDYQAHVYDLNKNYIYVDGYLAGSSTYYAITAPDNLGIFTYINNGSPSSSSYWGREHFEGKLFSAKIYDDGTLIREFIPCTRDSDSLAGLYDIVNNVFYYPPNYQNYPLTAGPIV